MKKILMSLSLTVVMVFGFANNNLNGNVDYSCTVSTTRSFTECNGDKHVVTVTNTGDTCYDAWASNNNELDDFGRGIACPQE